MIYDIILYKGDDSMRHEFFMKRLPNQVIYSIFGNVIGFGVLIYALVNSEVYWFIGIIMIAFFTYIIVYYISGYTSKPKLILESDSFMYWNRTQYESYIYSDIRKIEKFSNLLRPNKGVIHWDSFEIQFKNTSMKVVINPLLMDCDKNELINFFESKIV